MEDFLNILKLSTDLELELREIHQQCLNEVHELFFGVPTPTQVAEINNIAEQIIAASPQHPKKRAKRLSSLHEDEAEETVSIGDDKSPRRSARTSNSQLLTVADTINSITQETTLNSTATLMPPPPVPEASFSRPQRSAKMNVKSFKEPSVNRKMRQPDKNEEVKIKLEHEQRISQIGSKTQIELENTSAIASLSNESAAVVSGEKSLIVPPVHESADNDSNAVENDGKKLCVKIKREKLSIGEQPNISPNESDVNEESSFKTPLTVPLPIQNKKNETVVNDESTVLSATLSTNTTTTTNDTIPTKKGRKKKNMEHRPIKVERFSDIGKEAPVSSRTRQGSHGSRNSEDSQKARTTIYQDAVENLPPTELKMPQSAITTNNETVTLSNATMTMDCTKVVDATFKVDPLSNATMAMAKNVGSSDMTFDIANDPMANATITIAKNAGTGDATFNVPPTTDNGGNDQNSISTNKSMETAIGGSPLERHDSLMTEDNSFEHEALTVNSNSVMDKKNPTAAPKPLPVPHGPASAKSYKMPTRTHELFNPLMQSPVKMRVEAFEHAAQAASDDPRKNTRSKTAKENATPNANSYNGVNTPVIGKLPPPTLSRFLTPTQTSNIAPISSAQPKKAPLSASKATSLLTKSASATNLKATNSCSAKTLSRENSGDDFRKGLHQLAEERKKQREQKHLLAAQQREAKERERAERMAKLAKEREEKRLRKQQEAEQKKREIEELNRKLKQQEDVEAQKKAKAKEQERALLLQMKQQQAKQKIMMPPPPKTKYTFEMLHEDDSTDEEDKVSYKRPPPPTWSRTHVRAAAIDLQQYCPTEVIDSFFSVEPTTPDLKLIFPNIDARYLKRNSSVLWSTPPRYSELPKY